MLRLSPRASKRRMGAPVCWLCEKSGPLPEKLAGLHFHKQCRLAVRNEDYFLRQRCENLPPAGRAQVLDDEKKSMKDNAGEWRKQTIKFVGNNSVSDKKEGRKSSMDARFSIKAKSFLNGEVDLQDDLVLTKAPYRHHRNVAEGIEAAAAYADFDKLLEQQAGKYNHSSGVARVRVQQLDAKVRKYLGFGKPRRHQLPSRGRRKPGELVAVTDGLVATCHRSRISAPRLVFSRTTIALATGEAPAVRNEGVEIGNLSR